MALKTVVVEPQMLREERAAAYLDCSIRHFRRLDLPYKQPDGTRRKAQRMYTLADLRAYRDANGTWRTRVADAARRTRTKLTYNGQPFSSCRHYDRWRNMVARCTDALHPDYADYGGRGISVHEPWLTDPIAFFEYLDQIDQPPGYSLDRIDNDGAYEPGNLRWADAAQQNQNRRDWADWDNFVPCCWCVDCDHDAVTCPIEALDWAAVRRALGLTGREPFNFARARKNFNRTRYRDLRLPGSRPEVRSEPTSERPVDDEEARLEWLNYLIGLDFELGRHEGAPELPTGRDGTVF